MTEPLASLGFQIPNHRLLMITRVLATIKASPLGKFEFHVSLGNKITRIILA